MMAVTNTLATIPGILVPIVVGQLTHGNVSDHVEQYKTCIISAVSCDSATKNY